MNSSRWIINPYFTGMALSPYFYEIESSRICDLNTVRIGDGCFLGNLVHVSSFYTQFFSRGIYSYWKNYHWQCGHSDEHYYASDLVMHADCHIAKPPRKQTFVLSVYLIIYIDDCNS